MFKTLYRSIGAPMLIFFFRVLSLVNRKIAEGLRLRNEVQWPMPHEIKARSGRGLLWFHVSSGEFEYARPVIRELKKIGYGILVTYFSPSVRPALLHCSDVDFAVPTPLETPAAWRGFLDHFNPSLLAIARTDLWPEMLWQAEHLPTLLFSATLPAESGRVAGALSRAFYRSFVSTLKLISCVSKDDASNFRRIAPYVAISIDGDTRFDRVRERLLEIRSLGPVLEKINGAFIVGSSWPDDEVHVLPCLPTLLQKKIPVIIAPHEPTNAHLEFLEAQLAQLAVKSARLSMLEKGERTAIADTVVLIDRIGILADVYRIAAVAYIGGSFRQGIHSVMEAAAHGCVCVFGPKHRNNREALALLSDGLAGSVSNSLELNTFLSFQFAKAAAERKAQQKQIQTWVEKRTGATAVVVEKLMGLLLSHP